MTRIKQKDLDYYIDRVESHLKKRYPDLQFEVVKFSNREATIYYKPHIEEEDFPIIHRAGGILTDALVESDIRIWIHPA